MIKIKNVVISVEATDWKEAQGSSLDAGNMLFLDLSEKYSVFTY